MHDDAIGCVGGNCNWSHYLEAEKKMNTSFLVLVLLVLTTTAVAFRNLHRPSFHTFLPATTSDFKNGLTIEVDGVPNKIMEFLHVKPGKGSAFVRTKIKNMIAGTTQEKTFRAGESITIAQLDKSTMQYTFEEGENVAFMDMETFEEVRIPKKNFDNILLLKPGLEVKTLAYNGEVIDVELPQQVTYTVVECPPNESGNSKQGVTKSATLDSGAVINVPMFIEQGTDIIITTADCKYVGRAQGDKKSF